MSSSDLQFDSKIKVWHYLRGKDWKISRAAFYDHCIEGKLRPSKTGKYEIKAVAIYAKTHLVDKITGEKVDDAELQRRKLEADTKRSETAAARAEYDFGIIQGKYIPREDVELELAGRAVVLDSALKYMVQSRAHEWVRLVGGDPANPPDLIEAMGNDLDQTLNEFARSDNFQVVIKADEQN